MTSALDFSKYIINKCTEEQHPISNLQLQKILYYVQKTFLQIDMQAFDDEFEAWQFGPVVREVYNHYCGFGASRIRLSYENELPSDVQKIINPIIVSKRVLNPWDMVEDTHTKGKAWDIIYNNGLGNHQVIPKSLIKEKG